MDANIILPEELYVKYFYTGSSVICNPPVTNTDIDIMFLTEDMKDFEAELKEDGWSACSPEEYEEFDTSCWKAYRKGKLNYLFTDNKEYYVAFLAATLDAKEKNLLKKEDRIALFDTYLNKFKKDLTPEQKQSIIEAKKRKNDLLFSQYTLSSYILGFNTTPTQMTNGSWTDYVIRTVPW